MDTRTLHVRRRHPAPLRARPPRGRPTRDPGEHRRDRDAAGRHRRRLHQEHPQRPRLLVHPAHGREARAARQLVVRKAFNPNGDASWFTSIVAIINQITTLTVVLTGAAVIREREHGTLEHLLVMPLTPFEIAMAKVWANGLVILAGRRRLAVPGGPDAAGGAVRRLARACASSASCSTCSSPPRSGIFLGTISRSMAQFALLIILVIIVLQLLSAAARPSRASRVAAAAHAAPPLAALRQLLAGHHLPRRRPGDRLAAVPGRRRDRPRVLRLQPAPVPAIDRRQPVGN